MKCHFCGTSVENLVFDHDFVVCRTCKQAVRNILVQMFTDTDLDVFALEPLDRNYSVDGGEFVYLHTREQFYRLEVDKEKRTTSGQRATERKMIYLQPVPENKPRVPITDLAGEIGRAMERNEFLLVSLPETDILDYESWWKSALVFAPTPDDLDSLPRRIKRSADQSASQ